MGSDYNLEAAAALKKCTLTPIMFSDPHYVWVSRASVLLGHHRHLCDGHGSKAKYA